MFRVKKTMPGKDFQGSSPAPFIGRVGYPNVYVGILSPPEVKEDAWLYDAPNHWASNDFQIPEIVSYRSSLVNSRHKSNIKDTPWRRQRLAAGQYRLQERQLASD